MRTLSATLTAAQKSKSASPYLQVRIIEKVAGVGRLTWERLYTGAEPDSQHAAGHSSNGRLWRFRLSGGVLQYMRITSPGTGSDFATWSQLLPGPYTAIAATVLGQRVMGFGYAAGTVTWWESIDDGGSEDGTGSFAVTGCDGPMAAAYKSNGDICLFYSVAGTLYVRKRLSGVWGAEAAWTNTTTTIRGLAAFYQGDYNLVVTGQGTDTHEYVWSCIYGDDYSIAAGSWDSLREITMAASGSSFQFTYPSLAQPDVFRSFFLEEYAGSPSYKRPSWSYQVPTADFISNLWREPTPFNLSTACGLAIAYATGPSGEGYVWLSNPSGVWRAPLISGTGLDVSADVLSASFDQSLGRPGKAYVMLRNDNAQYASPGSGSLLAIAKGSQVSIAPGYATTAGPSGEGEVSAGPTFWIEEITHTASQGHAELVLGLIDAWGLLATWAARRQYTWAGTKNVFQLLRWVFARVGLEFSAIGGGASTFSQNYYPTFTIHAGESGETAVRRLLALIPDQLFFRNNYAYIFQPLSTEAAAYTYGPSVEGETDHPILSGVYASLAQRYNQVQVFGVDVYSEALTWAEIEKVYARLHQAADMSLTTAADCATRAAGDIRDQVIASMGAKITVPVNCGQEVLDVVAVTDSRANLSAAKRRVLALAFSYLTGSKPAYHQTLTMGDV